MSKPSASAGRRLSIVTVDQIIAGASNVLIAVLAARTLGVASFGLFGIVFILYVTAQGAVRALVCEPLLVHPVEAEERPNDAIGTAAVLGIGVGLVLAAGGLLALPWDRGLGGAILVLGAAMPLLALEDLGRYLGFATHRASFSVVLDTLWLVLMVVAVVLFASRDSSSLVLFIALWAGSGALAGSLVLVRYRGRRLRLSLDWLRETWGFSWRYLVAYSATQGAALAASVGIGEISGTRTLGAVRGALLLVRPVVTLQAAAVAAGTAEVSRISHTEDRVLSRHVTRTTILTTAVALGNLAFLLVLPDAVGRQVLGATWEPTQKLLLPASAQMVLLALTSGRRSALVGLRLVRITMRIDIASTVILLVAPLVGAALGDAVGAYWAFVVGQGLVAVIWMVVYRRRPDPPPHVPDAGGDPPEVVASHAETVALTDAGQVTSVPTGEAPDRAAGLDRPLA